MIKIIMENIDQDGRRAKTVLPNQYLLHAGPKCPCHAILVFFSQNFLIFYYYKYSTWALFPILKFPAILKAIWHAVGFLILMKNAHICLLYLNYFELECLSGKIVLQSKVEFATFFTWLTLIHIHIHKGNTSILPKCQLVRKKNMYY